MLNAAFIHERFFRLHRRCDFPKITSAQWNRRCSRPWKGDALVATSRADDFWKIRSCSRGLKDCSSLWEPDTQARNYAYTFFIFSLNLPKSYIISHSPFYWFPFPKHEIPFFQQVPRFPFTSSGLQCLTLNPYSKTLQQTFTNSFWWSWDSASQFGKLYLFVQGQKNLVLKQLSHDHPCESTKVLITKLNRSQR